MGKWTVDTLKEHEKALRHADRRFERERDRRYAEVAQEREKALKIKETADLAALELAREIQTYKDEKANQLREQISSERGLYASKSDVKAVEEKLLATITPLVEFVSGQRALVSGVVSQRQLITVVTGIAAVLVAVVAVYLSTR